MYSTTHLATQNFEAHLRNNSYPGRGLVIGRSTTIGSWLIIYWIMGRSEQSRNRRFVASNSTLRTEPVDAALVRDPSLIIYEAMLDLPPIYLVSNGDQTRTIYEALKAGGSFEQALAIRRHEPDAPNYTPRISGMLDLRNLEGEVTLSILKANPLDATFTDRYTIRPAVPQPGFGVGLTTYQRDGEPLPSFQGDALLLPCHGSPSEVLDLYWDALNRENRVALAVKLIKPGGSSELFIKNRFDRA